MRVGLLSYNAREGDAIGQQVAARLAFFLDRGAAVRVFLEDARQVHPRVKAHAALVSDGILTAAQHAYLMSCDLLVWEYGQFYRLLDGLPQLAESAARILVDYHGVTPAPLWGEHNSEALARGVAQRGLLWFADGVLVHSSYTHQELQRDCGLPCERLFRSVYASELSPPVTRTEGQRFRRKQGMADATVLLHVGRFAPNKRVPLLIEALHHLRETAPPVHLCLVGDDTDLYAQEAERCRQLARQLGVQERVHFLGPLAGAALSQAYDAADIFVTASAWESFCIPVVEAMACGLPVIAAHAAALPETVADAGLTFPLDHAQELAQAVRKLAEDRRLYETMQQRGRERAALFTHAVWRQQFTAIVEQILHRPPRPAEMRLEVSPPRPRCVPQGRCSLRVPVRIANCGSHPALASATILCAQVIQAGSGQAVTDIARTPLPRTLLPNQKMSAAADLPLPPESGEYLVQLWCSRADRSESRPASTRTMQLKVTAVPAAAPSACAGFLENVQHDLEEARQAQSLPDDYLDITQGLLAKLKRRIKQKLLHNFKSAYVDVLSRRQSAFNRQLLRAVTDLAECCTLLDQAVRHLQKERSARRRRRRASAGTRRSAADAGRE